MTMSIFYTCYMSSGPPSPHTGCTPQVSLLSLKEDLNQVQLLSSLCSFYLCCITVLEPKLRSAESAGVLFQTAANCCVSRICAHIYRHVFQSRPVRPRLNQEIVQRTQADLSHVPKHLEIFDKCSTMSALE